MAKIQIQNYSFDASEKKITLTDYTTIRLDSILLITNVTDNIIIYNFADPLLGGTVATNVLTLTYNTVSMSDTDKLQIWYDEVSANSTPLNTPTTTAVTLTNASTTYLLPTSQLADRRTLIIYNVSDTDMFIGSSSVTTTNGILLPSGGTMNIDVSTGLYAVCGSAGKIINCLEFK